MKIPYASPNLRLLDLFSALLIPERKSEKRLKNYFSTLTGKQHILITNSCRSALFLAYQAIGTKGEVVTSPLTCKVAIDPIIESGNTPVFADIDPGDLNILPDEILRNVTDKTIAIQAIHLGGVACNMERIMSIARQQGLWVIEDCAQSLGANWQDKSAGSFGDIACFSLIKNAYGIGGGILATNDETIYTKALGINDRLGNVSSILMWYRIFRNLLDSGRTFAPVFVLYQFLISLKKDRQSYESIQRQLYRIGGIEKKIAAHQLSRWNILHEKRRKIGRLYYEHLVKIGLMKNYRFDPASSSFTKLFVYHPSINSRKHIKMLNRLGIEAMHLEHKTGSPCQKRLVSSISKNDKAPLLNYDKVHDCLISLPVFENMPKEYQQMIVKVFYKNLIGKDS